MSPLRFRGGRGARLWLILPWWGAALLGAADPRPDKSSYTLARPTPAALLRELSTDRPDDTESPFTVDAGHVQIEMDFGNYTGNRRDGVHTTEWGLAPFNLRLGLLNDLEAGIFLSPYIRHTETPPGGPRETHAGRGDITLRGKYNFWGNDDGDSAGGLILDLKLPTAAAGLGNDAVEGGVLLPVNFDLGAGWGLAAMTEGDFNRKEDDTGREWVWANSVSASHDITARLGGYVELTSQTGAGPHVAALDAGLTFKFDANTQADVGVKFGLSRAADDAVVFAGLARRY